MKQTKHTPGPWTVESYHDGFIKITKPDFKIGDEVSHRLEYDKLLIAAAPEMLAALELIQSNSRLMNALNTSKDRNIFDAIQNAISKARGE